MRGQQRPTGTLGEGRVPRDLVQFLDQSGTFDEHTLMNKQNVVSQLVDPCEGVLLAAHLKATEHYRNLLSICNKLLPRMKGIRSKDITDLTRVCERLVRVKPRELPLGRVWFHRSGAHELFEACVGGLEAVAAATTDEFDCLHVPTAFEESCRNIVRYVLFDTMRCRLHDLPRPMVYVLHTQLPWELCHCARYEQFGIVEDDEPQKVPGEMDSIFTYLAGIFEFRGGNTQVYVVKLLLLFARSPQQRWAALSTLLKRPDILSQCYPQDAATKLWDEVVVPMVLDPFLKSWQPIGVSEVSLERDVVLPARMAFGADDRLGHIASTREMVWLLLLNKVGEHARRNVLEHWAPKYSYGGMSPWPARRSMQPILPFDMGQHARFLAYLVAAIPAWCWSSFTPSEELYFAVEYELLKMHGGGVKTGATSVSWFNVPLSTLKIQHLVEYVDQMRQQVRPAKWGKRSLCLTGKCIRHQLTIELVILERMLTSIVVVSAPSHHCVAADVSHGKSCSAATTTTTQKTYLCLDVVRIILSYCHGNVRCPSNFFKYFIEDG